MAIHGPNDPAQTSHPFNATMIRTKLNDLYRMKKALIHCSRKVCTLPLRSKSSHGWVSVGLPEFIGSIPHGHVGHGISGPLSEPAGFQDVDPGPTRVVKLDSPAGFDMPELATTCQTCPKLGSVSGTAHVALFGPPKIQYLRYVWRCLMSHNLLVRDLVPKAFSADLEVPYGLREPLLPSVCCFYHVLSNNFSDIFFGK